MKKILYLLLFFPLGVFAQTTDKNYVKTIYYKQASTSSVANPSPVVASVGVTYLDGLGRPIQHIANQQSGTGNDLIKTITYDAQGAVAKEYLAYATSGTSMNYDSSFATNASNFPEYSGQTSYRETQYENSPLHRVLKSSQAGNDWDLPTSTADPDHTKRIEYYNATSADKVKIYKVQSTWNSLTGVYDINLTAAGSAFYGSDELTKTVVKNENWTVINGNNNTTQDFKNKEGNLILKRTFNANIAYDTYYVYDQFGNLTYIIPPAVTNITTQLADMCYQYKYDYRNRLVEKKVPGKDWQYIVYDKLNRVVATGPSFSPFSDIIDSGWLITKYDVFNRVVFNGWLQTTTAFNSSSRKIFQDSQNGATVLSETKTTSGVIDAITTYYTNNVAPTNIKLLSVNYYDNYTYPNVQPTPTTIENQTPLSNPKGLITGSWIRINTKSGKTVGETNTLFYDAKGRLIRSYNKNFLGGYTQNDLKLDFVGIPQYTITYHKRLTTDTELKVTNNFTYTPQGRLLLHTHQIGTGATELLSKNEYNELGQLISKKVGGNDISAATYFQKIDYSYNILGWLTGINDIDTLTQPSAPQDLFAFKINYNVVENESGYTGVPLYNGNIAETYWRTATDNTKRKYGYFYDHLNRFTQAVYQKPGAAVPVTNAYNETISYDSNGNITSLRRNGLTDGNGSSPAINIDNLTYNYDTINTNKLLSVSDSPTTNTSGFSDGNTTGDDYKYDKIGNLTIDLNKGISNIIYNHLNLPTLITFTSGSKIEYIYNSSGIKVQKVVTQISGTTTTITTTDYLTGFQYRNAVLQFFTTIEGYVAKVSSAYKYVYQYKDHLGNTRVSYTKNTTTGNLEIIEESHFYPFGLKQIGYNATILNSGNTEAQKYKFQEQERQEELGLNWDSFKWRNYDYSIGRFVGVDPLAENYSNWTPYAFAGNQVLHSREIEGLEPEDDLNDNDRSPTWNGVDQDPDGDGWLHEAIVSAHYYNDYNPAEESYGYEYNEEDTLELEIYDVADDLASFVSDFWNSAEMRLLIPDRIYISFSYNANPGVGVSNDFSLNWITRGNDASFIPYAVTTVAGTVGMLNGGVGIGAGGGYFPVLDMRSLSEGTASNAMLGWGLVGTAFGAVDGGRVSLNGSIGIDGSPNDINGVTWFTGGASVGFGSPGFGGYGGVSHSTPSFGTKTRF